MASDRGAFLKTKRIKIKIRRRNGTNIVVKSYAYCSGMSIHVLKQYARQCSSGDRLNSLVTAMSEVTYSITKVNERRSS